MSLAPFLLPLLTKKLIDRKAAIQEAQDQEASFKRREDDLKEAQQEYQEAADRLTSAKKKAGLEVGLDLIGQAFTGMPAPLPDISRQAGETALDGLQRIIDAYTHDNYAELKDAIKQDLENNPDMHSSLDGVKEMYNVQSDDELPVLYPLIPAVFKDDLNKLGVAMPSGGGL